MSDAARGAAGQGGARAIRNPFSSILTHFWPKFTPPSRWAAMENGKVRFRWKDYAQGNKPSVMTLDAAEFIRRFLMHVMPRSFVHSRYYGFMANRHRGKNLERCRQLLGQRKTP